jgi:hypothetical protein
MGIAFTRTIQREAHINLIDQTSDRLCLCQADSKASHINQILTPNVLD